MTRAIGPNYMKPFGIRTKLVLSYLALGAGLMLLSVLANRQVELAARRSTGQRIEMLRQTQELAVLANSATEEGLSYVLMGDVRERELALSKIDTMAGRVRELSAISALTPREAILLDVVGKAVDAFKASGGAMFSSYTEAGAVPREIYETYDAALDRLVEQIAMLNATARAQGEAEAISLRRRSDLFTIGIGLVALILAFAVGGALGRQITGPLLRLHNAVLAFGRGEIAIHLPEPSADEVGRLASAFGKMVEDTRRYIETIRQAQQRVDDVFASIREILIVCDERGIIVAANTAACAVSGLTEEMLKGSRATALFTPESSGSLDRALVFPTEGDCLFAAAGGTRMPVRLSLSSLRGPAGQGWVLVAQDLTEWRRMESELRQAQKLEAIGRLASGVAHEINTPVQFVGDNLQFVRDACPDLFSVIDKYRRAGAALAESRAPALAEAIEEEKRIDLVYLRENVGQALDRSIEGLGRIATIVRSMKEFAHPDRHEIVSADLNRLVESTLVIARHEYKYVADLVTEFGDVPPVDCVPGEFNQAVLNIVVNAAHAIGDVVNGTDDKGTITVRTHLDGDQGVVSIADSGRGIPASIREKIFDPFFTTKEMGRGTGQGLAIVRSIIVGRHGGTIRVESEVGRGTTFHIGIPVTRNAGRSEAA
jgi:PAS domain S-box-containing protein